MPEFYKTKRFARRVRDHVKRQKAAYILGGVAVLLLQGSIRNSKGFDKFLTEKGIDPLEFWNPEWYQEKLNG